ncbi:winged helix-turn-helix domain-containing protein [Roseomonas sp. KE2513]|uniref:ATP-binding protein n=1 Tax=Roseomonas sp. KE2513 TaxID=2479202 RepID=UPI0018DFBFEB|nr:winged helix-turn-helix domain-containing protein [Roseomonas sp. KE2513]
MADEPLAFGDFLFHHSSRTLMLKGAPVTLGGPARSLLAALLAKPGEVVSAAALMESAWPGSARAEGNLRVQITALRKALAAVPEAQGAILNIPGRGYQFALPVRRLSAASVVGPPDEEAGRSPSLLTRLIGREREIVLLAERLEDQRLVTLAGAGGIGKTSLALAASREWASPGRRLRFLDLTAISDPGLLPAATAGALGLGTPGLDPVEELGSALRGETMLIFDGAEHLADATAQLAERLLKRNLALRLLVTSREPLGAPGEWLHRLAPLAVPPETEVGGVVEVLAYPAAQLFVERAAARLGTFRPRDADAAALALLCRRLDGLPLAITLTASRIDMFGIAGLAAGMADLLAAPGLSRRSTPGRHRTMRATLDWSYDALPSVDQCLLRRLSVFHGPFSVLSARTIAGEGMPADAERALMRLETKSLLHRVEEVEADGRQLRRLLATTRAYAAEKLAASGEAPAVQRRHALHMLERVQAAETARGGAAPAAWRAAHVVLADDLRAAVDWAFGPEGEMEIGLRLLARSSALWLGLNLAAEYRHRLDLALSRLAATGAAETRAALRLHIAAGMAALHNTGEVALMAEPLRRAIEIAGRIGDAAAAIPAIGGHWMACIMAGDALGAERVAAELQARIPPDAPPHSPMRLAHHRMAGLTMHYLGNQQEARWHASIALRHLPARTDTSPFGLMIDHATAVHVLQARLLWLDGQFESARQAAETSLVAAMAADAALSLCYALTQAGIPIAVWTGDPAAPALVERLAATSLRHRLLHWSGWARCFGSVLVESGELPSLPRELELTPYHLEVMATMHPALADTATIARAEAGQAAWCAPELLRAKAENLLRRAGAEVGAAWAAERVLREALALAERQEVRVWTLRCATSLARLWRRQGEQGRAEDLLSPILATFAEGREMPDLRAARAVLEADSP